jgi:hypothetical protein
MILDDTNCNKTILAINSRTTTGQQPKGNVILNNRIKDIIAFKVEYFIFSVDTPVILENEGSMLYLRSNTLTSMSGANQFHIASGTNSFNHTAEPASSVLSFCTPTWVGAAPQQLKFSSGYSQKVYLPRATTLDQMDWQVTTTTNPMTIPTNYTIDIVIAFYH